MTKLLRALTVFSFLCLAHFGITQSFDSLLLTLENSDRATQLNQLEKEWEQFLTTDFDYSLKVAKKGLEIARQAEDSSAIALFQSATGKSFQKLSRQDSAMVYHTKSLEAYRSLNDVKMQAETLNEMARLQRKLQNNERALEYYDEAMDLYQSIDDKEGEAKIYNESGVVYGQMGEYDQALENYQSSLKLQRERKDSVGIGYSLEFIGYNYLLQEQYSQAEDYLLNALEIRKAINDRFALCLNYHVLGDLYSKLGSYSRSAEYIKQSNSISEELNYPDIRRYNYQVLITNQENQNNYQQALLYQRELNELNDSLYNIEKIKNTEELNVKFQTAEKERELFEEQAKVAQQKLQLNKQYMFIAGLIFLILSAGTISYLLFQKQKKENDYQIALEKIDSQQRLENQRLAISRDLHDNIGAQLTFIISALQMMRHTFAKEDEAMQEKLGNIQTFTKQTIHELRDTVWAMNQSEVPLSSLTDRLKKFVANSVVNSTSTVIEYNDMIEEDKKVFSSTTGINIYRILQEAIHNAVKHSNATKIDIVTKKETDHYQFIVRDNGSGFQVNSVETSNGLVNMEERARAIGAEYHLASNENGTVVTLSIQ